MFCRNLGTADRALRALIGILLISLVYFVPTPWGWIGLIPLATAIISFCPLYLPFRLNTAGK